jgi:hypothetical protein
MSATTRAAGASASRVVRAREKAARATQHNTIKKGQSARHIPRYGCQPLTIVGETDTEADAEADALLVAAADALPLGDSDRLALPLGDGVEEDETLADREALPEPLGAWLGDDASEAATLPDALAGGTLLVTLAPLLLVLVDDTPGCVADGDASMLPVRVPVVVDDAAALLAAAAGLLL